MKNRSLPILTALFLALTATSCSKYGHVYLDYPQDPVAYLPEDVFKVAVVNRSLTKEEASQQKIREAVVTAEIAGSDKLASDNALKGVFDGMQGNPDIQIIIPQQTRLYGTGTRETPELLDWVRVAEICDSAGADVLLVLENFDSNSDLFIAAAAEQVSSVITSGKPSTRVPDRVRVDVRCYWRLYNPKTKTIVDQYQQTYLMTFDLVAGVPPLDALPLTAYGAGMDYIQRFLPGFYTVKRQMYRKGKGRDKQNFRAGWRSAEVAKWEQAIEIWKPIAENGNRKSAGRAALNIAVAYEVLGDTDEALKWAQRAYEQYGNKQAREYSKILLRRKSF